jgi:DNA-binding IclR family transcriptional regulator
MSKSVPSAERALKVLEFFALVRRAATMSEVQAALEIPQSSTSVLLHSLEDQGYLEFIPKGRLYRPTPRVTALGAWLKLDTDINLDSDVLDALCKSTRETVLIARQRGSQAQYVRIVLPNEEVQFYMQEGSRRPLSTSASGRALLSAMNDQAVRKLVRRNNNDAKAAGFPMNENDILASVREIRRTGISETNLNHPGTLDYHAIAVLLPTKKNTSPLALCIAGPRQRILKQRRKLIDALRDVVKA